jgi:hypothetical protein
MAAVVVRPIARIVVSTAMAVYAATAPTDSLMRSSRETAMQDVVYTLGVWKVQAGREAEFVAAWKELGEIFGELQHPPGTGTLIQSLSDPTLFYSFGPWTRLQDVEEMRNNPRAQAGVQRLIALCTEATPGTFRLVAEVPADSPRSP